eukprot:TRINITY_DN18633_c0_g1_i1.p2 TRINITY_DN18633_c0_g1~~TRINITY_DN18633_c0_g1_i1.p2  ORF type:complete len:240 (+),score=75.74 TRINITY_DN18633_c0_g1_i1:418-1137(+)
MLLRLWFVFILCFSDDNSTRIVQEQEEVAKARHTGGKQGIKKQKQKKQQSRSSRVASQKLVRLVEGVEQLGLALEEAFERHVVAEICFAIGASIVTAKEVFCVHFDYADSEYRSVSERALDAGARLMLRQFTRAMLQADDPSSAGAQSNSKRTRKLNVLVRTVDPKNNHAAMDMFTRKPESFVNPATKDKRTATRRRRRRRSPRIVRLVLGETDAVEDIVSDLSQAGRWWQFQSTISGL